MAVSESSVQEYVLRDPDVRLMLEVRDDSTEAYTELVNRYRNRLVTILDHLTGRRDRGEELAQEVFMRVFRSRKTYVPGSKFSTWLFTIANNVASNDLRNMSRRREVHLDQQDSGSFSANPMDGLAVAGSGQMPARQADKMEMRDIVRAAIDTLNERQRMAVLLSKFEEMSYAEIAETMDMSPQAVKSLLSRARENLRIALEPYLERGQRPAPQP